MTGCGECGEPHRFHEKPLVLAFHAVIVWVRTLTPTYPSLVNAFDMTDNIERLILEQFRVLRNQIGAMQSEMHTEFGDVEHRINRLESAIAGIRRDEAGIAEDIARQ